MGNNNNSNNNIENDHVQQMVRPNSGLWAPFYSQTQAKSQAMLSNI